MENNTFSYTYSAKQQQELNDIRRKYLPKTEDKMETLRRLDASVTQKANSVSIAVGIIGSLIMGGGMSLVMTVGGRWTPAGIVIGVIGMALAALAYPIHTRTVKRERERIAPEILRLTDELMK